MIRVLYVLRLCRPYHIDELGQRHLNVNGDLLAVVNSWSDQFVVALW